MDCLMAIAHAMRDHYEKHETDPVFVLHPDVLERLLKGSAEVDLEQDEALKEAGVVGHLWGNVILKSASIPETPGWRII
jgi:hypothetical protein